MVTLSFWFQSHAIWVSMASPGPFSQNTPFCASSGEPGHCGHQGCVKVSLSLYFETPTVWLSTDWTLAIKICHFELTWDPTDPKQSPHFQKKLLSFDFLIYTVCPPVSLPYPQNNFGGSYVGLAIKYSVLFSFHNGEPERAGGGP